MLTKQQYVLGDFLIGILAWDLFFCRAKHTGGLNFTCVLRVLGLEQHSSCSDYKVTEVFRYHAGFGKIKGRSGGFSSDYGLVRTFLITQTLDFLTAEVIFLKTENSS